MKKTTNAADVNATDVKPAAAATATEAQTTAVNDKAMAHIEADTVVSAEPKKSGMRKHITAAAEIGSDIGMSFVRGVAIGAGVTIGVILINRIFGENTTEQA